jgi:hypothetical protein
MNDQDLTRMQRRLDDAMCSASDNGGVELLEAASFSTEELARLLSACSERQNGFNERDDAAYAEPRGSRCLCPACTADYRVMAALG